MSPEEVQMAKDNLKKSNQPLVQFVISIDVFTRISGDERNRTLPTTIYLHPSVIEYREKLDQVAERLLDVETLTRDEFEAIFPPPLPKNGGTPMPLAA